MALKVDKLPQPPSVGNRQLPRKKVKLDVREEFAAIRALYPETTKKATFLIVGPHGTGKTYGMSNAPAPVLIHSFDVEGSSCIPREHIESGRVIIDNRFENDTPSNPYAFRAWETEYKRLRDGGIFEHVGTYVIDSFTRFADSVMNQILADRGRKPSDKAADLKKDPDIIPEMQDYLVHQKTIAMYLGDITGLPCHVVLLAHLNIEKDEKSGAMMSRILMDGRSFAQKMPTLFSEVYYAETKGPPTALKYYYRLVPSGHRAARSRLRSDGVLDVTEPQDLKALLQKAGYPYEDKPLFTGQPEEE